MRTQDEFVAARKKEWDELQLLLAPAGGLHRLAPALISRVAGLYRAVCADLMRARAAGYDSQLVAHLDDLAGRAHNTLYAAPPHRMSAAWLLFARDFPRAIRRRARFLAFAAALFLIPGLVGFAGARSSRAFAAEVLPEEQLSQMEQSYSKGFNDGREPGVNAFMAGFYVRNNVGIAFRCFATGILFALGSMFFLIYNGLIIGTVMGFVARAGHGYNIFTFCCGHSTFELTAIVISGAAGIQMGYALVSTGGLTRFGSLRQQSREIAQLILGAAAMLLIAAGIEGFWSPSSVPPPVKWSVAGGLAILVTTYFLVAGRGRRAAKAAA